MNMKANRVTCVSIRLAPTPRLAWGAKLCSEWVDTTPNCLIGRIGSTRRSRGRRRRRPGAGAVGAGDSVREVSRIALTWSDCPTELNRLRHPTLKLTESSGATWVTSEGTLTKGGPKAQGPWTS